MVSTISELDSLIKKISSYSQIDVLQKAEDVSIDTALKLELASITRLAQYNNRTIELLKQYSTVENQDELNEEVFATKLSEIRKILRYAEAQARSVPNNNTTQTEWLLFDSIQAITGQTITDLKQVVETIESYQPTYRR